MAVDPSVVVIDLARDQKLDAFAIQTLRERYMLPYETSPQHAFARASAAFADDAAHAQRLYDYVSRQWFMFATPLLANGGSTRGQPISCFLTTVDDSREGIFEHYAEVGWMSSIGGGVGSYYGALRSNGERTSKGSRSTGVIPFIAVDDRLILAVSQGDTRRGSHAVYIDVWHPEIREFVTIRKTNGGDDNRKGLNLHNGVNITDEFMICVRDDKPFALRSPKTGEVTGWENARELWTLILETRKQTGEPYLFFVDEANRQLPATQRAKGLRVNHSNLCVSGDTELLTSEGHKPIEGLVGRHVYVHNGKDWSLVKVEQTGVDQEMVRVWFEDGAYLDCTPYHKFYDESGVEHRAGALMPGTVLEYAALPRPERTDSVGLELAYAAGWATFAGYEEGNRLNVFVPESAGETAVKRLMTHSVDMASDTMLDEDGETLIVGHTLRFEPKTIPAGHTPLTWTASARQAWLAGALDAVGDWIEIDGRRWLCLGSDDRDMIKQMRLMALELGMAPRIRLTDTLHGFMVCPADVPNFCLRHKGTPVGWPRPANPSPVIADVHPLPWRSTTYCVNEPRRHRAVFNGVLTGNCTEITLGTGWDNDGKKRTAVCCLSSVNAETYDEWKDSPRFIEDLMRMLDNVLTIFIETAPEALKHAIYSAQMERSVGLGCLGFHAYLQKNMIAFESEEARGVNTPLFKHIRAKADKASLGLGAERGEAPDMIGTGHRFAHRIAIAPNASSSIVTGNTTPSIELRPANVFLAKTLSGSFTVKNPYLERELAKEGLNTPAVWKYIIAAKGSITGLATYLEENTDWEVPAQRMAELIAVFKTAMETNQRWVVQHAIDRQPYVDQAQSLNLFFGRDADPDEVSQIHIMAWAGGLKSLYYYRSERASSAENVNTKVERAKTVGAEDLPVEVGAAPVADEGCFMCEG